jgi:hypothetical protein
LAHRRQTTIPAPGMGRHIPVAPCHPRGRGPDRPEAALGPDPDPGFYGELVLSGKVVPWKA